MHTITLCYSLHPSVAPVIKSESTLGISEVVVYGLPVSNGFMLPVRITRGDLYWAPCVSAPRLSIARFRTRAARGGYVHIEDAAPRGPLSVPPWLLPCECWAVACARVCGPGGAVCRGTFSRTEERSSSISVLVVCMIAGIVYTYSTKGIRSKNGGLPLMLTVILLSSIRVGPLLKSCRYARRSLSVVHATK
jgi:hypothetical protein